MRDAEVAPQLSRLGFEVFLLPSPEHRQVWHSAARLPDNAALHPGAHGGLDDDIIDALLTEVRKVIGSAKFGVALKVRGIKDGHSRRSPLFVFAMADVSRKGPEVLYELISWP